MQQLVHPHQQRKSAALDLREIGLRIDEFLALAVGPCQNLLHPGEAQNRSDPGGQFVLRIHKRSGGLHLMQDFSGQIIMQIGSIEGDPEGCR